MQEFNLFELLGLPSAIGHKLEKVTASDRLSVLVNSLGVPYLIVAELNEASESEALQLLATSEIVGTAVLVSADNLASKLYRKNFRTGDIEQPQALEKFKVTGKGFLLAGGAEPNARSLSPINTKIESILFELHSALRDIDGLHAPDALDEICKLLYAKIFDEENIVRSSIPIFQRALYLSTEECSAAIRKLYKDAVDYDASVFSNRIPGYARSRGVFKESIKLSSQAISRSVQLIEWFNFSTSDIDIKGRAFQNVLTPATRAGMGQYFTPREVIDICMKLLSPSVMDVVIDPFCGSGHFLSSALDFVRSRCDSNSKSFHEFAFSRLHGIEKSERMVRIAMTDMRLHGDGHSNIRCTDALLPFDSYADLNEESFDIVATNPPFGVDLPVDAISQLGPFDIMHSMQRQTKSVSLEILAIDRCIKLLRPGGRMAIVLPDGVLSNRGTFYVREWITANAKINAVISLPIETFTPFGANIKTSVLILRKLHKGESYNPHYPIFLAEIDSVGHDSTGRPTRGDDSDSLIRKFSDFVSEHGW